MADEDDPLQSVLKAVAGQSRQPGDDAERTALLGRGTPGSSLQTALRAADAALTPAGSRQPGAPFEAGRRFGEHAPCPRIPRFPRPSTT